MNPKPNCVSHMLLCAHVGVRLDCFHLVLFVHSSVLFCFVFFKCSPAETLAFPSEYLCLRGLSIKRGTLCFHFLSDSGNPDQGLELCLCL